MLLAIFTTAIMLGFVTLGIFAIRGYRAKPWLPNYVKWKTSNKLMSRSVSSLTHVMFLFVDHFEPWEDTDDPRIAKSRMDCWVNNYPQMASKHRDANGFMPRHTWFYLVEDWQWKEYDEGFLRQLGALSYDGFGEVELHVHHGAPQRIFPDVNSPEKLHSFIEEMKSFFSQTGALVTAEEVPRQPYGFIHGKWALDNAMDGMYCGVDNEIEVLQETGCYADFTMPSGIQSQSRKINSIYYPTGNPLCPKSFDWGVDVKAGALNNGRLMIFSGMIDIYFRNFFWGGSIVEKSNLDHNDVPTERRIDTWIKSNIHVKDRPQWIFVKVHTHGAREQDFDVSFGELADKMHAYLEEKYNDGERYKLHYVTTREAYNIVKAAEAGENGDPSLFRDYLIKPHANTKIKSRGPYRLSAYRHNSFKIEPLDQRKKADFIFKESMLRRVEGISLSFFEYLACEESRSITVNLKGDGKVALEILMPEAKNRNGIDVTNAKICDKKEQLLRLETKLDLNEEKTVTIRY